MKTLRKKLESMIVGGEGPSPIEYSVMVILLVAASGRGSFPDEEKSLAHSSFGVL